VRLLDIFEILFALIQMVIALAGYIFLLIQLFLNRKEKKRDNERHQKEIAIMQANFERQLKEVKTHYKTKKKLMNRPDPAIDLSCQVNSINQISYILSTVGVNNLGKNDLHISKAFHIIEKGIRLDNGEYKFMEFVKLYDLLGKLDESSEGKEHPEFIYIDYLQEFLIECDQLIGYNEQLQTQVLHSIEYPGFYRVIFAIQPNEPEWEEILDYLFIRNQIIHIP